MKVKLRLIGIDTPEIRTIDKDEKVAAIAVRDFLREKILGKTVRLHSVKKGKYGRYLSTLWELDDDGNPLEESINSELLRTGMAKKYGWKTASPPVC